MKLISKKQFGGFIKFLPKILKLNKKNKITKNFYKFIQDKPKPGNYEFTDFQKAQLKLLSNAGVNINGISPDMLVRAYQKRINAINKSAPKNWNLHTITFPPIYSNVKGVSNGRVVGDIDLILNKQKNVHVGMVRNLTNDMHGIQERMSNAGINVAHSYGGKGLISGEELVQP